MNDIQEILLNFILESVHNLGFMAAERIAFHGKANSKLRKLIYP